MKNFILRKATNMQKSCLYLNTSVTKPFKINLLSSPLVLSFLCNIWFFIEIKVKPCWIFFPPPPFFFLIIG